MFQNFYFACECIRFYQKIYFELLNSWSLIPLLNFSTLSLQLSTVRVSRNVLKSKYTNLFQDCVGTITAKMILLNSWFLVIVFCKYLVHGDHSSFSEEKGKLIFAHVVRLNFESSRFTILKKYPFSLVIPTW